MTSDGGSPTFLEWPFFTGPQHSELAVRLDAWARKTSRAALFVERGKNADDRLEQRACRTSGGRRHRGGGGGGGVGGGGLGTRYSVSPEEIADSLPISNPEGPLLHGKTRLNPARKRHEKGISIVRLARVDPRDPGATPTLLAGFLRVPCQGGLRQTGGRHFPWQVHEETGRNSIFPAWAGTGEREASPRTFALFRIKPAGRVPTWRPFNAAARRNR